MKITYQKSPTLTPAIKHIREAVFVHEQGFTDEFDEIDNYAVHLTFYDGDTPIGVCRYYRPKQSTPQDTQNTAYTLGRIALLKDYRGKHLGQYIMTAAEEAIAADGGQTISLSAQIRVQPFYEKLGYHPQGIPYLDEHCPHILMTKQLRD